MSATTEDIAVFGQLYLQDGVWDGRQVLPEGWVARGDARAGAERRRTRTSTGRRATGTSSGAGGHDSYRGDGAFGQYCVVLPEQDVVVAITSGVGEMHGELALVWEHLLPGLSDGPLPGRPRRAPLLAERLAGCASTRRTARRRRRRATRLSGRTITFEPNTLGIRNAVLEVGDGHDRLTVDHGEETVIVSVGHAQPALTRTTAAAPRSRGRPGQRHVDDARTPTC